MKTVGDFRNTGGVVVVGDLFNLGDEPTVELNEIGVKNANAGICDHWALHSFAWRENTGEKPSFNGFIDVVTSSGVLHEGYQHDSVSFCFDDDRFDCYVVKWRPSLNQPPVEIEAIFTQAMADTGELPPVGSEFMYSIGGDFEHGKMLFNDGVTVLICSAKYQRNRWHWKSDDPALKFKPIKSEREKAIDEMSRIVEMEHGSAGRAYNRYCSTLHNANYRKLTPSQAKAYDDKTGYFGEDYK